MQQNYLFIFLVIIILGGCASFPSDQLTLDLTKETIPVMLNTNSSSEPTKIFEFESGYASASATTSSSSRYNGQSVSVSVTAIASTNINKPLNFQLHNTFVQNPAWISVSDLFLYANVFKTINSSKVQYLLVLNIEVPMSNE
ncbi:MAG: hypothetical protein JXR70_01115 [Spirochaetales bacterium]|nr:hypothetical protein [Spirochaetales bacterium]